MTTIACILLRLRAVVLAGALAVAPAWAAEISGVSLPATETVRGREFQLAGCAAREMLWTNLYALSLYLPQGATGTATAAVRDDTVPKLLRLDVTYDGRVPNGLPDDWTERLRTEVSREFMRTLRGLYDGLRGGDAVRISYLPGEGTMLSVNGRTVVAQPGSGLMDGILGLWLGQDPVSANMKRLLLSGSC